MRQTFTLLFLLVLLIPCIANAQKQDLDWTKIEEETMLHFQSLLRINTSDPPGNEAPAVEYLKSVLEKEGIEVKIFSLVPNRPNLVARLKGSGKARPVLIMGHTDVVSVDSTKWKYPPFSATRKDGYVYGRGAVDDKDNAVAGLMVMLLMKRTKLPLDRDVIFLAEAGEEGSVKYGIDFMVNQHFEEIDAEYCFAEGGGVTRTGGKIQQARIATTEKIPYGVRLIARGISGHGSVPLRTNAIVHLSQAVAKVAAWQTPMRLNETTRSFFERLAATSPPEDAARYQTILSGNNTEASQEYFAVNVPSLNSVLRTSISPNIFKGGYRSNVIPSEAEATLDIRALPDENLPQLISEMRRIINDSMVEIVTPTNISRPGAAPSRINTEAFKVIEAAVKDNYNTITLPSMLTGATDMSFLRTRGIQCYGMGPMIDSEDGPKGFGAHSDQERILEESLHRFVRFQWDIVRNLAVAGKKK